MERGRQIEGIMRFSEASQGVRNDLKGFFPTIADDTSVEGNIQDYLRAIAEQPSSKRVEWGELVSEVANKVGKSAAKSVPMHDQTHSPAPENDRRSLQEGAKFIGDVLTEADKVRLDKLAAVCREDAEKRVVPYRDHFFAGRTLSAEEYERFVNSPALGVFSLSELRAAGVDDLLTPSTILEAKSDMSLDRLFNSVGLETLVSFVVAFPTLGVTLTAEKQWAELNETNIAVHVFEGSVLAQFSEVSSILAKNYFWNHSSAKRFVATGASDWPSLSCGSHAVIVLTGQPFPNVRPVDALIKMQVPYWLTVKQVSAIYRSISSSTPGEYNPQATTKASGRPKKPLAFALMGFVEKQVEIRGIVGEWTDDDKEEIHKAWTRDHAEYGSKGRLMEAIKRQSGGVRRRSR